ncbi:DUF1444 family protein [Actinomadura rugatobispora]|uniref:DUF1444 family protein n=1 Tax=Actinomadura rugatobispora TaxID=1994 RepID=A0ABW1A6Q9_9ACTN|nr:hypothetical protein GCM10010200_017390 [Actinomadura rugatobispora]
MTEPRTSLIVPLMKARVPAEVQLEFPLPPEEEPIRDPFAGDLYITYALELSGESAAAEALRPEPGGRRYEHVARRHCAELGLAPEELRRLATVNLRNLRPDLRMSWYPDARAVTVSLGEGGLEAGLLLDDGFLEKLAQDVEGDLVVATPGRDVFVASGTGHPDGVDKLRWAVERVWSEDQGDGDPDPAWNVPAGHLLTRELRVWREGVWSPLGA